MKEDKKDIKKVDMSQFVPVKQLKVSSKAYSAVMYGVKIC